MKFATYFSFTAAVLAEVSWALESDVTTIHYPNDSADRINYLKEYMQFFEKYNANLDWADFQVGTPVIGIPTMPSVEQFDDDSFPYSQYTWEHNVNFVHYAGNFAVPILYDLEDEDLYAVLDQINGVFMTGGGVTQFDEEGNPQRHYQTMRKIFEYSKKQKDDFGITFPVFTICQGFEQIHFMMNDDDPETLGNVVMYHQSRPLNWQVDPKTESNLFSDFPEELLDIMGKDDVVLHAHDYVVTSDLYKQNPAVRDFFKILAVDEKVYEDGTTKEFVMAAEAHDYPITGIMFHTETQQIRVMGDIKNATEGKMNNETTDTINYYFSNFLFQEAKKSLPSHKFKDVNFGKRMEYFNAPVALSGLYGSYLVTYGLQ